MKILLVQKYSVIEPLGLMVLGFALKSKGHSVDYYLYKGNSISFDKNITIYDMVGFSTYTGNHICVYDACKKLRSLGIKTSIGGHHATFFYEECKKYSDYVFKGESVLSFPDLNDHDIYPLVDADKLIPDRKGFYEYSKEHKNSKIKSIMTSFGCPFDCSYCYNSQYNELYGGSFIRQRTVDSVLKESTGLECDLIFFQDDFFGFNNKWFKEFIKKWDGRPYHAQLRIETLNDDKIIMLKNSGCVSVTVAIETYSEKYRKEMLNRNMSNNTIIKNCNKILNCGIGLRTEQMLGLPNTKTEDELNLLKMNCEIKPTIAWTSIFQPYLGTKLGNYCKNLGLYDGNNDDIGESFFNYSVLNYDEKRKREIIKLQKCFTICAHIPNGWEYAEKILNNDDDIKEHLYSLLYKIKK